MASSISPAAPIRKCVDTCGKEVKPGDLIQISRDVWSNHWAVYVGDGDVVYLVPHGFWPGKGVVLKEKLEDVVKKDKWRVNNLLDDEYTPRPAVVIVEEACLLVKTELQYNQKYNCEHFASEMRYSEPESRQVKAALRAEGEAITAEASVLLPVAAQGKALASFLGVSSSLAIPIIKYFDKCGTEIKPGDLIEFFHLSFNHWAVYVGCGNVVHFANTGFLVGEGKVSKEKLQNVKNNYRRVNNFLDHKYIPRPADDIVKQACSMKDTELQYNVLTYNCEHFANEMRYGKPECRQVKDKAAAAAAAAAGAGVGLAVAGPVGAVVGGVAAVGVAVVGAGARTSS